MSGLVRTVLALLMALTLNASMTLAASSHEPSHHSQVTTLEPCEHHGHEGKVAGQDQAQTPHGCMQQACPACLGLPLTLMQAARLNDQLVLDPLPAAHDSAGWRSGLLRPPIHI